MFSGFAGKGRKGQTTMIVIILMIIVFMALGIFFVLSSFREPSKEYANLYTHNLLVSFLRSTTGLGSPCDSHADVIACAHLAPTECSGRNCAEIADEIIPDLLDKLVKENFDYYLVIEPENYALVGGKRIAYGNPAVGTKEEVSTANEKILQYESNIMIRLMIAKK